MKKISLFLIALLFSFSFTAQAYWYLYRTSSGEVVGMSKNEYALPQDSEFSQIENPTAVDGQNLQPPKIIDGANLRNATSIERDMFILKQEEDSNLAERKLAKDQLTSKSSVFKLQRAVSMVTFKSIMETRNKVNEIISVSGLNVDPLPNRTWPQLIQAVKNELDSGNVDA